jgi:hypothetical protein
MHYGILGMRWGVRRSEAQLRRARGSKKNDDDLDTNNKAKSNKPKSFREMDDDEITKAVNRLKKEKEYVDLNNYLNPEKVSTGKKFVTNFKNNMANKSAETMSSLANDWFKKKGLKLLGLDTKAEEDKVMEELMKKHNYLKTVSAMYTYADNIKKKSGETNTSTTSSEGKKQEWADWTMNDVDKSASTDYGQKVVERLLTEKEKD